MARDIPPRPPPPFGRSAEAFLAARGVVPEPPATAPIRPARRFAPRDPVAEIDRPVDPIDVSRAIDLEPTVTGRPRAGRSRPGQRGTAPKQWPTREEREQRQAAKQQLRANEVADDPVGVAREVCLRLLGVGPRTRQELTVALTRRGVPAEVTQQVLGRFAEVGVIDDALLASMWVSSRHRSRGLAGRALGQELRRKGVDDELIQAAVGELDPEQEEETARRLVHRKVRSTRGLTTEARVRRLVGMLARKGYGAGLSFRVVSQALASEGEEPPELSFDALHNP